MSGKPAAKADAKAESASPPKPAAAPKEAKPADAKAAKGAALPDAALLDDGAANADNAAPARTGFKAWLPSSRRGWIIAGSAAASVAVVTVGAVIGLSRMSAPVAAAIGPVSGPAAALDGATVTVSGRTLRLAAIEAPPSSLVCRDGPWKYRCGEDARRGLEQAIGGRPVECMVQAADAAVCRNEMGFDIAALQVESGWAVINVRQSSRYFAEQARAQQEARGLWRNDFARPETWRLAERGDKNQGDGLSAQVNR